MVEKDIYPKCAPAGQQQNSRTYKCKMQIQWNGKELNRYFPKEDMQSITRYAGECSLSLKSAKICIIAHLSEWLLPKQWKTNTTKNVGEKPLHMAPVENNNQNFYCSSKSYKCDLAVCLLRIHQKEVELAFWRVAHAHQSRQIIQVSINRRNVVYIHNGVLSVFKKKEILQLKTIWINLWDMLSVKWAKWRKIMSHGLVYTLKGLMF